MGYIFGGNTGETPESLKKKRDQAAQMLWQPRRINNLGEGIKSASDSIFGTLLQKRAEEQIAAGRAGASERFNSSAMREAMFGQGLTNPNAPKIAPMVAPGTAGNLPQGDFDRDALHQAQLMQESGGDPNAVSSAGAQGLMQIMPATAKQPGFGMQPLANPMDPKANEAFGRKYMDKMLSRYDNDVPRSLAAYNWGAGNADQWDGDINSLPEETRNYIEKITAGSGQQQTAQAAPQQQQSHGVDPVLLKAFSDPWTPVEQKRLIGMKIQQQMQANAPVDPMKKLQMERLGLQNNKLRNPAAPERKTVKDMNGRLRYLDDGAAAFPDVEAQVDPMKKLQMERLGLQNNKLRNPAAPERKILKGADGFQYFQDDASRVLPGVEAQPGEGTEYGLNPQYGIDPDGKPVIIQLGKNGTSIQTPLPENVRLSTKPIKLDAGTHYIILDPITRQPVGRIEKQLQSAASQKALGAVEGKALGEAMTRLPQSGAALENTIRLTDEVLNHASLDDAVGPVDGMVPTFKAGTRDFESRVNQLKNVAFMSARQELKGGGAITDYEGNKAEQALNRASLATSEADFKIAMTEFMEAMQRGHAILQLQAGKQSQGTNQSADDPLGLF